jgi:hypothetical protein
MIKGRSLKRGDENWVDNNNFDNNNFDNNNFDNNSNSLLNNTPVNESPVRKSPVKKQPVRKSPVKKQPVRKSPVKKQPVRKSPVKKQPVKKQPVKKSPSMNGRRMLIQANVKDSFLNFRLARTNHKRAIMQMKPFFRMQEKAYLGREVENACESMKTGGSLVSLGMHQVSVYVMARRIAEGIKDGGKMPDDMPSGCLVFHSTGSGKTHVAGLIFTAFFDILNSGVMSPNVDREHILSVGRHPVLGIDQYPFFRTHVSFSEFPSRFDRPKPFEFKTRESGAGSVNGVLTSMVNRPFAAPGSHRRVIYVTTQENINNNSEFPEKELMLQTMFSEFKNKRDVYEAIIQMRGERFEVMSFDTLATILFGSRVQTSQAKQMSGWFANGCRPNPGISSQQAGRHAMYDPYYCVGATLIFDEAQNLYRPISKHSQDVLRYYRLRKLLTSPRERVKTQVSGVHTLFEDPQQRSLASQCGRAYGCSVWILTATPGENQRQLMEMMNMMNTPKEYQQGVKHMELTEKMHSRISFIDRSLDEAYFPRRGEDYVHQTPLSDAEMDKTLNEARCPDAAPASSFNEHVRKLMENEYGSYFEYPVRLRDQDGMLVPDLVNGKPVPNPNYTKMYGSKNRVSAHKEFTGEGANKKLKYEIKASACDYDTLRVHNVTGDYRRHEKKYTAMAASKIKRLRNVIMRTPREKHYVYWAVGVSESVQYYNLHDFMKKVFPPGSRPLQDIAKGDEAKAREALQEHKEHKPSAAQMAKYLGLGSKVSKDAKDLYYAKPRAQGTGGDQMTQETLMYRFPVKDAEKQFMEYASGSYELLDAAKLKFDGTTFMYKGSPISKAPRYAALCRIPQDTSKYPCYGGAKQETLKRLYNHPMNKHGEYIHVLFAGQRYHEGLDLKSTIHVHLMTPLSATDKRQAIGRSARFCSMDQIPFKSRRTHVHNYYAVYPGNGAETVDHQIAEHARRHDEIGRLKQRMLELAYDCETMEPLHKGKCRKVATGFSGGRYRRLGSWLTEFFQKSVEQEKLEATIRASTQLGGLGVVVNLSGASVTGKAKKHGSILGS